MNNEENLPPKISIHWAVALKWDSKSIEIFGFDLVRELNSFLLCMILFVAWQSPLYLQNSNQTKCRG